MNWRDLAFEVDGGDERLERKPTATLLSKTGQRITDGFASPTDAALDGVELLIRQTTSSFGESSQLVTLSSPSAPSRVDPATRHCSLARLSVLDLD